MGCFGLTFHGVEKLESLTTSFPTRQTFYPLVTENVQIIRVGISNFEGNLHAHRNGQPNLKHIQAENFFTIANIWVIFPNHGNKNFCCSHSKRAFVPAVFQERLAGSHEFFHSAFPWVFWTYTRLLWSELEEFQGNLWLQFKTFSSGRNCSTTRKINS